MQSYFTSKVLHPGLRANILKIKTELLNYEYLKSIELLFIIKHYIFIKINWYFEINCITFLYLSLIHSCEIEHNGLRNIYSPYLLLRGTRSRTWLRHYALSRKVAGSIPDEVIEFSIDLIFTATLRPLTEMSTRNLPGFKGRRGRKADTLTAVCEPTVYKMWVPRRWASKACYRDSFAFISSYASNSWYTFHLGRRKPRYGLL
jgi:hypothetical protein